MQFLTAALAAVEIDPTDPPSRETLQRYHDKVNGPRDAAGRRVWTPEICAKVREARAASGAARAGRPS